MNILFTLAYPLYGTGSGTDTRNVMDAAKKSGHKVSVLCADDKTTYEKDSDMKYYTAPFKSLADDAEVIPEQCDFPYIMFTSHPAGKTLNYFTPEASLDIILEYNKAFEKKLNEAISKEKPDLINAQHNWLLSAQVARTDIPMVLKIHGTDLMGYVKSQELVEKITESISKNKNKELKTKADEILARSSGAKEICEKLNKMIAENKGNEEAISLINQYKELAKYKLYISESEYSASHADEVIVISEAQKEEFIRLFPNEANKVNLIGNGYNTDVFYPEKVDKEEVFSKLTSANTEDGKIPTDYDSLILFVGKFADFKGIDSMLLANKMYDEKLRAEGKKPLTVIVGSGQLEESLKKEAKDLGLENTHFVGRQGHDIIRQLQNLAEASLVPSRDEPFGLVVLEALACIDDKRGIVIASNSGGIPDILNTEKEKLDSNQDEIVTKLGVLIKPLPKTPEGLTKEQGENLNSIAYTYFASDENSREAVLESLLKRLKTSKENLLTYFKEYYQSTQALANAVVKTVTKEYEFDGKEIARYTRETFSQEAINGKVEEVYESAIKKHKDKHR